MGTRELGIALAVIGMVVAVVLGLLRGPEPEAICGRSPAVIVAVLGYGDDATELQKACRGSAIASTFWAVAIGGGLFGTGVLVAALDKMRAESARHHAFLAQQRWRQAVGYGALSDDGAWWWDGHRWLPIPPHLRRPKLPPPPG